MARTLTPAVRITLAGITPSGTDGTAGDVANGNYVDGNNGQTLFVAVANTGAASYTCTFVTPGTVGQGAYVVQDEVKTLAAGEKKWYGPFPLAEFTNQLQIDVQNVAVKLQPFII